MNSITSGVGATAPAASNSSGGSMEYATIIAALIGVVGTIWGNFVNSSETAAAQEEARGMYGAQNAKDAKQQTFNNRLAEQQMGMNQQQLGLQKDQMALTRRTADQNTFKSQLDTFNNMINNNQILKQHLGQLWGGKV